PIRTFAIDQFGRLLIIEPIRLGDIRTHLPRVDEPLHPHRTLKTRGAHESPKRRKNRESLIATPAQGLRQTTLDAPIRNPCYEIGEATETARREPGQHIVFGL